MPLVEPHGSGGLEPRLLDDEALAAERRRAATLPRLTVTSREKGDLIMLGIGGFMASARTCPHGEADRLDVSGTQLRQWLSEGAEVPPEFSRPEVLAILREYYAGL